MEELKGEIHDFAYPPFRIYPSKFQAPLYFRINFNCHTFQIWQVVGGLADDVKANSAVIGSPADDVKVNIAAHSPSRQKLSNHIPLTFYDIIDSLSLST